MEWLKNWLRSKLETPEDKIIRAFMKEYATQDNRATAFPIFFTICDKRRVYTKEGHGDEDVLVYDGQDYESENELGQRLGRDGMDKDEVRKAIRSAERFGVKWEPHYSNLFLTASAAESHLKRNHYKYHDSAHTYADHAYRSPELAEFLQALLRKYKIELEWR